MLLDLHDSPSEARRCLQVEDELGWNLALDGVVKIGRQIIRRSLKHVPEPVAKAEAARWDTMRRAEARHLTAATTVLAQLAGDDDADVRLAVAWYVGTPPATLKRLADDGAENVRVTVAWHPATPAETLAKLASDRAIDVRYAVAQHTMTPAETLARLASDEDADVRNAATSMARHRKP